MSETRSTSRDWIWGIAIGAVLAGYVGGYYATVERVIDGSSRSFDTIPKYPLSRVPEALPKWFFAPVHFVDRKIRPDHWW